MWLIDIKTISNVSAFKRDTEDDISVIKIPYLLFLTKTYFLKTSRQIPLLVESQI